MTAIETSAAGVTVSVAVPETEAEVAVIVEEPTATAVACPPEAMVAFDVSEEVQVAELVRSFVEPSL